MRESVPPWWSKTKQVAERVWIFIGNEKDSNEKYGTRGWQKFNAYSSLLLCVTGVVVWCLGYTYQSTLTPSQITLLGSLLWFVGLASFVFHSTEPGWWGNYDNLAVAWTSLFFLAANTSLMVPVDFWTLWLSCALACSFAVHTKLLGVGTLTILLLGAVASFGIVRWDNPAFLGSLGIALIGAGFYIVGRLKKWQVHWLWHQTTAIAALLGWVFYYLESVNR